MAILCKDLRLPICAVLLSGLLVGVAGMVEPGLSAADPPPSPGQDSAVTPDSPDKSEKGREGKGNHPMRKACAEDVKKLCSDVKAGEGRLVQCLKQHTQDLSQGCTQAMQQRRQHRQ